MVRRAINEMAKEFEDEVKKFLDDMDFNDIKGATDFKIGDKQVDVGGGINNTYVIIDCTTSFKDTKSIRNKIEQMRGNYNVYIQGLKEHDSLTKYNDIRLVIATKNFKINESDLSNVENKPKVYLWNTKFFEYYSDLNKKIGKYAKFELARELHIKDMNKAINRIPAIKVIDKDETAFYLGSINPLDLLEICYVARRERGEQAFYQRMIEDEKLNKINYYITKENKQFYNNIIVAINNRARIDFQKEKVVNGYEVGTLSIKEGDEAFWIIDGQHRLYGYAKAEQKLSSKGEEKERIIKNWYIPVALIFGLNERKQGNLFMEINTTQTPLKSDYIWDLHSIYNENRLEGFISKIVKQLNTEGFFKDKIYIPSLDVKAKKGKIGISKFGRTLFKHRRLLSELSLIEEWSRNESGVKKASVFINEIFYYINSKSPQLANFFTTNSSIQVAIPLFGDFLVVGKNTENCKKYCDYMVAYANSNPDFSPEKLKNLPRSISNASAKEDLIAKIVSGINTEINNANDKDLLALPTRERAGIYTFLEKRLRRFVFDKLNKNSKFRTMINGNTWKEIEKKAKIRATDEEIWNYADLGTCINVITQSDNWKNFFEPIFIGNKEAQYEKEEYFKDDMRRIIRGRNPITHGREISFQDKNIAELCANKLSELLKSLNY